MEAILELLNKLANKGIKLAVSGDDLNCYAKEGSLTEEIRDAIVRNKPKLIKLVRGYCDLSLNQSPQDTRNKTRKIRELIISAALLIDASVDLEAEAVLDLGIQPSAGSDGDADFAASNAIFLTGASGFLGAYLLHDLMINTEARVYCLVRCSSESDGGRRIKNNLLKYRLWSDDFERRILPVPGDLAQPLLGLAPETFESLSHVIDVIYHNGALVNFIYPYSNFKDSNIHGTQEVIRLAFQVRQKPLHFVSTGAIFPPTTNSTRVLESLPPSNWQALSDGYRQSKWVAEKIVTIAADRGLPIRIYRPGLVSGDSTTGICNTDDFLPRMIKGCIQLGSAPDSEAMIEMVPVDYVSKAIVHLSRQKELRSNVFHVVNPHYITARGLESIFYSLGYRVVLMSYWDWRAALFENAKISSRNALFPLLTMFTDAPLFERIPVFDCSHTLEGLRGTPVVCPEINKDLIATYLAYFKSSGFLDS